MTTASRIGRWASRPWALALLAGGLFLLVRSTHLVWSWNWPIGGDAIGYDQLGWATAQGEAWLNDAVGRPDWQYGPPGTPTAVRTPGLPVFLAAVYALVGHQPNVARALLVLFNAIAAGLLFDVSRRHWGRAPAIAIALAWTFWPVSVRALYYVDALLGESLAVPLLTVALWLVSLEKRWASFGAGVFLGAAVLTRPHLGLMPALLVVAAIASWRVMRAHAVRLALVLLGCAVIWAPWVHRNSVAFGALLPLSSQSGLGLWAGWVRGSTGSWNDTPADTALVTELAKSRPEILAGGELVKSKAYGEAARVEMSARGAWGVAMHGLKKLWLFVWPVEYIYGFNTALLLATLLAAFGVRRWFPTAAGQFAAMVWVALLISAVLTFFLGRYRFVATPSLLYLSGPAIERLWSRIVAARARTTA